MRNCGGIKNRKAIAIIVAVMILMELTLSVSVFSYVDAIGSFGIESTVSQTETQEVNEINETELFAKAAVIIDADSNRILYGKNENEALPMASTTKIMTCILALENGDLEDEVAVSSKAASMPKVKLFIKEGERYKLRDLLCSLMLESHNDTAVAIAEHLGGSVEGFADMMNQKAKEIGCNETYFITPNGLDASKQVQDENGESVGKVHSTTAHELAKIMSYCINESPKKEEFLEITRTSNYSFSDVDSKRSFSCNNHNAFLNMMEGALTGKTGFTNNAGYCYVGALRRDDKTFVVALLGCGWPNNKGYKWKDTMKLMNYALDNYEYEEFYETTDFTAIEVENGIKDEINPYLKTFVEVAEEDIDNDLKILLRKDETIEKYVYLPKTLEAPVKKGDKIGKIEYYLKSSDGNEMLLEEIAVYAKEDIYKIKLKNIFEYIFKSFVI